MNTRPIEDDPQSNQPFVCQMQLQRYRATALPRHAAAISNVFKHRLTTRGRCTSSSRSGSKGRSRLRRRTWQRSSESRGRGSGSECHRRGWRRRPGAAPEEVAVEGGGVAVSRMGVIGIGTGTGIGAGGHGWREARAGAWTILDGFRVHPEVLSVRSFFEQRGVLSFKPQNNEDRCPLMGGAGTEGYDKWTSKRTIKMQKCLKIQPF